jgi:hypothetical protein
VHTAAEDPVMRERPCSCRTRAADAVRRARSLTAGQHASTSPLAASARSDFARPEIRGR